MRHGTREGTRQASYLEQFGGPGGVYLKSRIFTGITFEAPCSFDDAIDCTLTLLRFLELVVGRPQNVLTLQVRVVSEEDTPCILDVYWSMPPRRKGNDVPRPHPADVLINGGMQRDEFARVLCNWLSRDDVWRDARERFSGCFHHQEVYGIDRLFGAANMFDILPKSAIPRKVVLSKELASTKARCKKTLNNQIRFRSKLLTDAVGERRFPDSLR